MENKKRIKIPVKQTRREKQAERRQIIQDLQEKGFKHTKLYPNLLINANGVIYNLNTRKELKADHRNTVHITGGKRLSVPRLVLFAFRNEPIREKSRIKYIDGNRSNLNLSNVEYIRIYENSRKTDVNAENLRTAIRCYFEVPKRYTVKDHIVTRMYLVQIIRKRCFYSENYERFGLDVFKSYMKGCVNNVKAVGKEHEMNFKDVQIIVNEFINLLTSDILADLEIGILKVKNYQPRPKTKTQAIREYNERLKTAGLKPLPLRRKSDKEVLRDFMRKTKEITK